MALGKLSNAAVPIFALVLLGICELLAIDLAANFIVIYGFSANAAFILTSGVLALSTALVLVWAAFRMSEGCPETAEWMGNGALAGFASSLAICVAMVAAAYFEAGVEKMMPGEASGVDTVSKIALYGMLSIIVVLTYSAAGAVAGIAGCLLCRMVRGKGEGKPAETLSSTLSEAKKKSQRDEGKVAKAEAKKPKSATA